MTTVPTVGIFLTTNHDPGDEDRSADLYCRNCGDPFGLDAESAAVCTVQHCQPGAHGTWRPCPNPSPGRPLVDCGVGGHMYTDATPRIS